VLYFVLKRAVYNENLFVLYVVFKDGYFIMSSYTCYILF